MLIILAGVSIQMLTGENGIITKAQEAKTRTEQAEQEELNTLSQVEQIYKTLRVGDSENALSNNELQAIAASVKASIKDEIINEAKASIVQEAIEGAVPIGTIISYSAGNVPTGYLACDGASLTIPASETDEYYNLYQVIGTTYNKTGDGASIFRVPDLRGEFLRGAGTATRNTGSGGTVGEHQDGTIFPSVFAANDQYVYAYKNAKNSNTMVSNVDKMHLSLNKQTRLDGVDEDFSWDGAASQFTARPTNTSVLYCIKYK